MNQTQGLGNAAFSISHKAVLEERDRIRVATQLLALLKNHLSKKTLKKLSVLDVGCSSGVITDHIAKHFGKTIGIDVDKSAIKTAQKKYKRNNLSFKTVRGIFLPCKNKSFDVVIYNQVYSYVSDQNKSVK